MFASDMSKENVAARPGGTGTPAKRKTAAAIATEQARAAAASNNTKTSAAVSSGADESAPDAGFERCFGVLTVISKKTRRCGSKFPITEAVATIGSDYQCDVRIQNDQVDRVHTKIHVDSKGDLWVTNMSKKLGTRFNSEFLTGARKVARNNRMPDIITVADRSFYISYPEALNAPSKAPPSETPLKKHRRILAPTSSQQPLNHATPSEPTGDLMTAALPEPSILPTRSVAPSRLITRPSMTSGAAGPMVSLPADSSAAAPASPKRASPRRSLLVQHSSDAMEVEENEAAAAEDVKKKAKEDEEEELGGKTTTTRVEEKKVEAEESHEPPESPRIKMLPAVTAEVPLASEYAHLEIADDPELATSLPLAPAGVQRAKGPSGGGRRLSIVSFRQRLSMEPSTPATPPPAAAVAHRSLPTPIRREVATTAAHRPSMRPAKRLATPTRAEIARRAAARPALVPQHTLGTALKQELKAAVASRPVMVAPRRMDTPTRTAIARKAAARPVVVPQYALSAQLTEELVQAAEALHEALESRAEALNTHKVPTPVRSGIAAAATKRQLTHEFRRKVRELLAPAIAQGVELRAVPTPTQDNCQNPEIPTPTLASLEQEEVAKEEETVEPPHILEEEEKVEEESAAAQGVATGLPNKGLSKTPNHPRSRKAAKVATSTTPMRASLDGRRTRLIAKRLSDQFSAELLSVVEESLKRSPKRPQPSTPLAAAEEPAMVVEPIIEEAPLASSPVRKSTTTHPAKWTTPLRTELQARAAAVAKRVSRRAMDLAMREAIAVKAAAMKASREARAVSAVQQVLTHSSPVSAAPSSPKIRKTPQKGGVQFAESSPVTKNTNRLRFVEERDLEADAPSRPSMRAASSRKSLAPALMMRKAAADHPKDARSALNKRKSLAPSMLEAAGRRSRRSMAPARLEEAVEENGKGDLTALRVAELRDRLHSLGLNTAGTKAVLVARLLEAAASQPLEAAEEEEATTAVQETAISTPMDWESMKVTELREHLRARGLSTAGKKVDMVERLRGSAIDSSEQNNLVEEHADVDNNEKTAASANVWTEAELNGFRVAELRAKADEAGLSSVGTKAVLVDRLLTHFAALAAGMAVELTQDSVAGSATLEVEEVEEEVESSSTPEYATWRVADLRAELTRRGLETSGVKQILVDRLMSASLPEESTTTPVDYSSWRVTELRAELERRHLNATGIKAVLIQRLQSA